VSDASALDGVVVVDKPVGVGSTDVVRVVRRAARQRRVGHTGTLDPGASGVLVVCLGRATRLVRFLQAGRKTYRASMVFGVETTTQDADGDVVAERSAAHLTEDIVCQALHDLVGERSQLPPMVSAVKVGGERLYEKARRGEDVDRPARTITIDELVLDEFQPGERAHATFLVTCSSGTFVRTLAHDTGRALGTGGSLTALRRLANGAFTEADAHPLDEVRARGDDGTLAEIVLSPAEALRGAPVFELDDAELVDVRHGRALPAKGCEDPYALLHDGALVAVYADSGEIARPEVVLIGGDAP